MLAMADKKLVDISGITIDQSLNKEERIKKYIEDIGNPYHFKIGDVEVVIRFESDGESLQEKLEKYFESMMI